MKLKYRSKEKEQQFLQHIENIFEDPLSLVPQCLHQGMFCPFAQYEKKLEQLRQSGRFDRYSGSADQFLSGIAETFKVKESNSAPVMGVISTPFGTVEYAKRGNTDPVVLAGIQNYNNETWRMLAFSTLVKSKGVKVFSSKTSFIGSCKGDAPGIDFFSEILDEHSIAHSTGEIIEIGSSELYFDLILFGTVTIRIHDDSKQNIIPSLMKHILIQDPMKDFSVSFPFLSDITEDIPADLLGLFFTGKKDNRSFVRNIMDYRKKVAATRGYSAIGDTVYQDYESFIGAFEDASYDPQTLLSLLLERNEGILIENASFRKLIEMLWPKSKEDIVTLYFPEFDISRIKSLSGDPMQVMNAIRSSMHQKVREQAISIEPWSQDSEYLIDLIKTHIMKGKEDAIRSGEKGATTKTRKSVFYSYLLAVDGARNREWMFATEEKELAQKLLPIMEKIVHSDGADCNAEIENFRIYVI